MNPLAILGFLTSPIGKWVSVGLLGVALFFAGELRGRRIANEKCEAAAQAAQIAANKQDSKARKEVAEQSEATISSLNQQKDEANARVAELERQLKVLPLDAPCLYGADGKPASSRLRQLPKGAAPRAGDPGASGPAGVSPPRSRPAGARGG